jgi:hypothetical protein
MTILDVIRSASVQLVGRRLTTLFGATDTLALELQEIANEAAQDIASRHDWQNLMQTAPLVGDGVTTAYDLPDDYDRMPLKANLVGEGFGLGYLPARDNDSWLRAQTGFSIGSPGRWIIQSNMMNLSPLLASGATVNYNYITNAIVSPADMSGNKREFTLDTDTFLLSERLLKLAIIWRHKAMKELEYTEAQKSAEIALAQAISRDRGSRGLLVVGDVRTPAGFY